MVRVFVSYSHDSDAHRDRVRALARRLAADGLRVRIDHDVGPGGPPNGWPLWSQHEVEDADRVLAVCTAAYRKRFDGREPPGRGLGAAYEALVIQQYLYEHGSANERVRAVVLADADAAHVPTTLKRFHWFAAHTDAGYADLLAWLRGAPAARAAADPAPRATVPAFAPGFLVAARWVAHAWALQRRRARQSRSPALAHRMEPRGAAAAPPDWTHFGAADFASLAARPEAPPPQLIGRTPSRPAASQPFFDLTAEADAARVRYENSVAAIAHAVLGVYFALPGARPLDCLPPPLRALDPDLHAAAAELVVDTQLRAERIAALPQPDTGGRIAFDVARAAAADGLRFPHMIAPTVLRAAYDVEWTQRLLRTDAGQPSPLERVAAALGIALDDKP